MTTAETPYLSAVVPVYNERESLAPLVAQLRAALEPMRRPYEILLVDDGSRDGSWDAIQALASEHPPLVGLRLHQNSGQTAALMAGIDHSRGEIVVTMDGDLQNDPADIPKLVAKIEEGYEIVSGWRRQRQDKLLSRRLPSVIANELIRRATRLAIHDQGCALKAYRGRVLRSVSLYSEFHRFIVPITQIGGARVAEVETHHRARLYGRSKYGLSRTFRVIADVTTLVMITRFTDRLLHWFLLFAAPPFVLGVAAAVWAALALANPVRGGILVPVGAAVLLLQSAVAIAVFGLLAERIRHLAPSQSHANDRVVATIVDGGAAAPTPLLISGIRATPLAGGGDTPPG